MIFAHLIQAASSLPTDASALEKSISALESAISALDSSIKAKDTSLVPWEGSVFVFTFLVVVGVAMEWWVIKHEWRDDMEAWALAHFGILRSPGSPSITKRRVEMGSVLLIAMGVMGELGVGIKIESINSALRGIDIELRSKNAELRSKSSQLLALVTRQAGEARDSALIAEASAKTAGIEAGKAQRKADAVSKKADGLNSELLTAKTQLAAVDAKRATLETSLRSLAVCNAPRVIENISKGGAKITDPLKGFAESATIETVPNDAEARRAASYLTGALQQAGWNATLGPPTGNIKDGVEVQSLGSSKAAEAVVDFLHSLYWQAKYEPWVNSIDRKTMPPTGLRIRVGLYPPVRYVLPPALNEFAANVPKWQQEINNDKAQMKENEEEYLKHFAPQIRDQVRASHEQLMKEKAVETEREFGPCKPLEPLFPRP